MWPATPSSTMCPSANTNLSGGGQWDKGKGCDTSPIGPWMVTKDEVADPQNLGLWLDVNGKRFQDGSTRTMIFPVGEAGELHQRVHVAAARRHHQHRHPRLAWAWVRSRLCT